MEVNNEIVGEGNEGNINVSLLQNAIANEGTEIANEMKMDIVFSFDTTGSMSSCIADVRRNIEKVSTKLFDQIPGLRLAIRHIHK